MSGPDLLSAMRERLRYLGERQNVISQNVANANTPGYKAQDLDAPDFNAMVKDASGDLQMAVTSAKHIRPEVASGHYRLVKSDSAYETAPDGNNVVLEEQMAKMAKTNMDYQETLNLYKKMNSMIKMALGRNG